MNKERFAIKLAGTSGSGKTTIVRSILSGYQHVKPVYEEGRKNPICYRCHSTWRKPLAIMGSYENPNNKPHMTGGCDTISHYDDLFRVIRERWAEGFNLLFEGLLVSHDAARTIKCIQEGIPILTVLLQVPDDVCLASVNARRQLRGKMEPVNPKNTLDKIRENERAAKRVEAAGGQVLRLSREEAYDFIEETVAL